MSLATSPFSDLLTRRGPAARSDAIRDILAAGAAPGVLSLAGGLPAPETFPTAELTAVTERVLAESAAAALQYAPTEGTPAMREVLARLATATGAPATAEQLLVTSGSQQGLDLVAGTLLQEGDTVALDDPSYLGAVQSFRRAGAALLPVPSDEDGMDTDALEARLAAGARCKLVYVVPHFHNPSGAVLSAARRRHLASLADEFGFVVLEDDPYADLGFAAARQPSMDVHTERVIRLMSLSKTLCPGLRVSGLKAPAELVHELAAAKQSADLQTNTLGQHILARLLADPEFLPRHVTRLQTFYRTKAGELSELIETKLPWLEFEQPSGGLFLWCAIADPDVTSDDLSRAALAEGVAIVPGTPFCIERDGSRNLRMSFATLSRPELATAVERLSTAFEKCRTGHSSNVHQT